MSKLYHCIESKVVKENDYYIILETSPFIPKTLVDEPLSLDLITAVEEDDERTN